VIIFLRSGGKLRDRLKPDVDQYTRRVEVEGDQSLRDILNEIGVPDSLDGDVITLQPPVSGG
jgi:molybdopterin converting factor small subunit